jgi:glycosyltransferase involved in cell wall biosynthesis
MQKNPDQPRRILFFFPYNPYPPRSGAQIRCLEILKGLLTLKCEVIFLSSKKYSEKTWDLESIEYLKKIGIKDIHIYQGTFFDLLITALIRRLYLLENRLPPADSIKHTSLGMRRWFRIIQVQCNPDVIWMNYSYNDALINRQEKTLPNLIIDYHDLVSLNQKMQNEIKRYLVIASSRPVKNKSVLQEDFFDKRSFSTDKKELEIITSYDTVVAISQNEANLLKNFDETANIVYIPVTYSPVDCTNSYLGSAILVAGPNIFNVQGLVYFTQNILPLILEKKREFDLKVVGTDSKVKIRQEGIIQFGSVDNLTEHYCSARFAICPILGGTGQQIKIIEAMAHGLPVVATRYSACTSPLVQGMNGFIADNAQEFAGYCVKLWEDPVLCKKMGDAARETIREKFSDDLLLTRLSEVLKRMRDKNNV